VGILSHIAGLDSKLIINKEKMFKEFKGSLAENFICNTLFRIFEVEPKYWTNEKPKAEVDFLIQYEDMIIPIEVKAGTNIRSQSLKYFAEVHQSKLMLRYSLKSLSLSGNVLNIPLYLSDYTKELVDLALKNL
jgi:predicted AAA+ superfamily ATPase